MRSRVWNMAKRYDRNLLHTDKRFRRAVQLIFEDGTMQFFHECFLMHHKDSNGVEWLCRFSEHHGFDVIAMDELKGWQQFKQIDNNPETLK